MSSRKLIVVALALGGVLSAGLAQARGEANVQWSVTIGTPVAVKSAPLRVTTVIPGMVLPGTGSHSPRAAGPRGRRGSSRSARCSPSPTGCDPPRS